MSINESPLTSPFCFQPLPWCIPTVIDDHVGYRTLISREHDVGSPSIKEDAALLRDSGLVFSITSSPNSPAKCVDGCRLGSW